MLFLPSENKPSIVNPRKGLDFNRHLHALPVRNKRIRTEYTTDGTIMIVEVPQRYTGWSRMLQNILKLRKTKTYRLEGVSLGLFHQIDGQADVENLIDWFMTENLLSFFEARALVMQYLAQLMARGLIVITFNQA